MESRLPPDRSQDRALTHRSLLMTGVFASVVILLVLVWYLIDVVVLVFAATLLALVVRTPADWLSSRTGLPVGWSLAVVLAAFGALLVAGAVVFGTTMAAQIAQLMQKLPEIIGSLTRRFEGYAWLVGGVDLRQLLTGGADFLGRGFRLLSSTFGAIAAFGIVVLMGIFFAIQPKLYIDGLVQLFAVHKRERIRGVLEAIGRILRWWLLGQLALMVAVGVMSGVGLWLIGVPFALALGVLSGLLNFVPYLGPIVATVPAVLVALAESPALAAYTLLLYAFVQAIEGNLLEPIVQQRAVYLAPALVLLAQVVLGILIGLPGVMLATPLAAAGMVAVKMLYIEDVLGAKARLPRQDG
ncbi:MAG TPA: AI-2E family transporter [Burkholderiales bacterium]